MNSKKFGLKFWNSTQVLVVNESKAHVIGVRKVSDLFMLFFLVRVCMLRVARDLDKEKGLKYNSV